MCEPQNWAALAAMPCAVIGGYGLSGMPQVTNEPLTFRRVKKSSIGKPSATSRVEMMML